MSGDGGILHLNERHAVVRIGGRAVVMTIDTDPVLGRTVYGFGSFQDIKNLYSN